MKLDDPEYGPIFPASVKEGNLYFLGRYELFKLEIITTKPFETHIDESPILQKLSR